MLWQKTVLINGSNRKWVDIGSKRKDGSFAINHVAVQNQKSGREEEVSKMRAC